MKIRNPWLAAGLLATASIAGHSQSTQDLPSAPSATVAPQNDPPPPPPAPAQKAETKPSGPIFKDLTPHKPQPKAAQQEPSNLEPPPDSAAPAKPAEQPKPIAKSTDGSGSQPIDNPQTTIKKQVQEVNVVFTVTDKHGNFIKGLKKEDFIILDDHRPPVNVRDFSAQSNLPLRVGLLIDASSSIREQFKFEQEAAVEFLSSIVRPKQDQAFVIGFDSTPELEAPFTNDMEQLFKGVRLIRPSGGTALFDAVYYACRDVVLKHRENEDTRKAIILISDGDDNTSRVTREEAIEMAQRAEVIIYTISTNLSNMHGDAGDKILERMSDATGGRAFHPFKIEDVANAFSDIQAELRSQYSIAYKPQDLVADGRFRSIEISTNNKKQRVRARKGYYAPKS